VAVAGAAVAASGGVDGVHSGASKQTSTSLPALPGPALSQSLTSPLSGRPGSRTTGTVFATPGKACAASYAFLGPASSLSSKISTSRPASALMQSSVQSPHATVVAQCPSEATRPASFSPSHTKTEASGYASRSGKRNGTRLQSFTLQIQPPLPSG